MHHCSRQQLKAHMINAMLAVHMHREDALPIAEYAVSLLLERNVIAIPRQHESREYHHAAMPCSGLYEAMQSAGYGDTIAHLACEELSCLID